MRVLGVDSGINGACALYSVASPSSPYQAGCFDIPTVGDGKQREIDYGGLRDLIWEYRPDIAFIEQITAFVPRDEETGEPVKWGGTSMLRFGGAYYGARAVIGCLNIPLRTVMAAQWKKEFNLKGGKSEKDRSRQLVIEQFPDMRPLLNRKLDGHRADAFLIAVYGAKKIRREEGELAIPV